MAGGTVAATVRAIVARGVAGGASNVVDEGPRMWCHHVCVCVWGGGYNV